MCLINGHDTKSLFYNFQKFKKKIKKTIYNYLPYNKGQRFYFTENNPFWHHKNNFTPQEVENLLACCK